MPNGNAVTRLRRAEAGYTYLLLLFAVAAMGLVTAGAAEMWSTLARREKEQELLFVGNQFREALRRYHEAVPDAPQRHPARLEDLLRDPRFPGVRRHLRQIYADPMTGHADWVLLRQGDLIVGVRSRAEGRPLKRSGFEQRDQDLAGAARYADWRFVVPSGTPGVQAGPARANKDEAGARAPVDRVASDASIMKR